MISLSSQACTTARFAVPGEAPRPLQLGCHALLDGRATIKRLARELPAVAADLIEIAARVYAVDRLVPRPGLREMRAGSTWARNLWLEMPVREPQLWDAHAGRLTELLAWLTDDNWNLEFFQLPEGTGPLDESQGFLFDTVPTGSAPVLFSGGLDSGAGLAAHLMHGDAVAISVDTNNWMQHVQQRVLQNLSTGFEHTCVPLRYRVSVRASSVESSQRSRGLLFLAAGIATAWALRQDRLRVFENGIGAINLPYLRSQFGSQATRSMHPRTLRLAEDLAAAISRKPFHVDAPALTVTKAHAIRMAPAIADPALALTVSCDTGFSARVRHHAPCGVCTSCLLRRQALHAAGRADLDAAASYRTSSPAGSAALQAMLWQVARLRTGLAQPDPWLGLVSEFPEVLDTAPLAPTEVINLHRSYVQEWEGLEGTSEISGQLWQQGGTAA
jgi:7-cyano-7-deazaguanine synthase in queuosine biosynthesis